MSEIKDTVLADIKACMKSGDKSRLGVLRLISSAVKQREVDERVDTDDAAMKSLNSISSKPTCRRNCRKMKSIHSSTKQLQTPELPLFVTWAR